MKILQVVAALTAGGVETLLHSYYEEMDREQFRCDVACFSHYDGVYRKKFEELGCRIAEIPSKRKLLKSFRALYRTMKSILAARFAGVPVRIVHSHLGKYPHSLPGRVLSAVTTPVMFRLANGYFACSEKAKQEFYPARLQDRVFIMKNGIQSRRFRFSPEDREEIRKQYGITDEQILVGCVARITEQKNPFFLLEIFSVLHRQDDRYRLMLVGDGTLREQVEAKIVGLGLQEYAVLTGPRDDAYRYYRPVLQRAGRICPAFAV